MSEANVPTAQPPGPSPGGAPGSRPAVWAAAGVAALLVLLALWFFGNNRNAGTSGGGEAGRGGSLPAAAGEGPGQALDHEESVNVLALGISDDAVDAVTVVTFNPQAEIIAAVAVPADTGLGDAAGEPRLLRDVYAEEGLRAMVRAVEDILQVPIHHTVQVDFDGFVALVDLLDGVEVDVETEIVYRNGAGETVFQLEPGVHRLTGEEALLYLRYKGDHLEDESRRVQRQWRFLTAVAHQAREKLDWRRVQGMITLAIRHVDTDLDVASATRLLQFAWHVESELALHLLPGRAQGGQWVLDPLQVRSLRESLFYNPSWVTAQR